MSDNGSKIGDVGVKPYAASYRKARDKISHILAQDELIEVVADKVARKVIPTYGSFANNVNVSQYVYIGNRQICRALGINPQNQVMEMLWDKGLVMDKGTGGRWRTTPRHIDDFIYKRYMLMAKLKEMGKKVVNGNGRGGYIELAQLEKYAPEVRAEAMREIIKDRITKQDG